MTRLFEQGQHEVLGIHGLMLEPRANVLRFGQCLARFLGQVVQIHKCSSSLRLKCSKLGIDATKKIPGEGFKRPWPPLIKMDAAVKAKVEKLFNPQQPT